MRAGWVESGAKDPPVFAAVAKIYPAGQELAALVRLAVLVHKAEPVEQNRL